MSAPRLVVEADGGSRGNPGPAAFGAVVRDADSGAVLAEIAEAIGHATNNVAEYRGVLAGLRWVHEQYPAAEVEARLDSKLVVEQMSGRWKIKHPDMKPLALAVRDAHPPALVSYRWVPREQNKHADRLLNDVLDGKRANGATAEPADDESSAAGAPDRPEPVADPPKITLSGPPDLKEATTLLLIRHGETALTQQRRFSGSGGADPGLAEAGFRQAQGAAEILTSRTGDFPPVDVVLSSPLRRARETAQVIAGRLNLSVEVQDDLTECAFGQWDGHTYAEIVAEDPERFWAWLSDTSLAPPDGESVDQLSRRVLDARSRILARYRRRCVAVVCHSTPVKVLVRAALDAPVRSLHTVDVSPGSVSELAYWTDNMVRVRSLNRTAVDSVSDF